MPQCHEAALPRCRDAASLHTHPYGSPGRSGASRCRAGSCRAKQPEVRRCNVTSHTPGRAPSPARPCNVADPAALSTGRETRSRDGGHAARPARRPGPRGWRAPRRGDTPGAIPTGRPSTLRGCGLSSTRVNGSGQAIGWRGDPWTPALACRERSSSRPPMEARPTSPASASPVLQPRDRPAGPRQDQPMRKRHRAGRHTRRSPEGMRGSRRASGAGETAAWWPANADRPSSRSSRSRPG